MSDHLAMRGRSTAAPKPKADSILERALDPVKLTVDSILSKEETRWSGVRELLFLAFPIIVMIGSNTLMNATDTWMVAQLGKKYMAAIMPAGLLNHVLVSFFIGILSCVNTFVGQSYGRRELRDCSHYTWQGIHLSMLIALGVMVLWPLTTDIFRLIGHPAELQPLEATYFRIRLWGMGGAVMTVALAAFFYATNRPIVPMIATILANVFNLAGDWVLIFGKLGFPKLGISGAAIATNISAWLCALMMLAVFLSRPFNETYASRRTWGWDWPKARRLFRVGWPAGVSMGLDIGSWAVFSCLILGRFGIDALAAGSATGQILAGSFMPTIALGIALTALVGQWIGRGNVQRAVARHKTALKIGVAYMTFMGVVFVVFRHSLIGIFRGEPEIVALGGKFLIFAAAFQLFDAIAIVTSGALKGAGDTKWPMVAQVLAAWCVFLPLGYVLAFHTRLGVLGGWVAAAVYIWLLGAALFWRFYSGKWKTIDIFDKVRESGAAPIDLPGEADDAFAGSEGQATLTKFDGAQDQPKTSEDEDELPQDTVGG